MIVNGVPTTLNEAMFAEWAMWSGKRINLLHKPCQLSTHFDDPRVEMETIIQIMAEHNCDRWAAKERVKNGKIQAKP